MILILTNKNDVSADLVVLELRRRGASYYRLNLEDAMDVQLSFSLPECRWELIRQDRRIDLSIEVTSVWYRRPEYPLGDQEGVSWGTKVFVRDQWWSFVRGLLSIPGVLWVNDPRRVIEAEVKIQQLVLAHKLGFRVPRTCVTNDLQAGCDFRDRCGTPIIGKALFSPLVYGDDGDAFIFTVPDPELSGVKASDLAVAPVIFQERLFPKTDYRVTVVGQHAFVARILDPDASELEVDWRRNKFGNRIEAAELDNRWVKACICLVEALGLTFGAIDLVEHGGEIYFLEINPNGEWGWLCQAGLPIPEAIADVLIRA